ncbi:MAG: squalene/phytoene synthase family protein [Verrucomicrobiae bacterium]|nr:squalene/phytoene synthase family protein [Verrucomicrobiae bacterium]
MWSKKHRELLGPLLKGVSRSFYLTLRVLPRAIRPQISLAYLLARATDTIADTGVVPRERRVELLRQMRTGQIEAVRELAAHQALPGERLLLERLDDCRALLRTFSADDQQRIHQLWQTIIDGQIFDLERFAGELTALADDAELDRYTYLVAGCVGEFWTRMCAAHFRRWNPASNEALGVRFGKGLQLVNILRDLAHDLRNGRCYLPVAEPRRLLEPAVFPEIQPLYQRWLDTAVEHLHAGWQYTMAIPTSLWRLRLACTWPIWIGLETITLLRDANPLNPARRVMVPQRTVNRMLAFTAAAFWHRGLLQKRHQLLQKKARGQLRRY